MGTADATVLPTFNILHEILHIKAEPTILSYFRALSIFFMKFVYQGWGGFLYAFVSFQYSSWNSQLGDIQGRRHGVLLVWLSIFFMKFVTLFLWGQSPRTKSFQYSSWNSRVFSAQHAKCRPVEVGVLLLFHLLKLPVELLSSGISLRILKGQVDTCPTRKPRLWERISLRILKVANGYMLPPHNSSV